MQKVLRALEIAAKAHGMVPRKYPVNGKQVPFIIHPIAVANRVAMYLNEWPSAAQFHPHREDMLVVCALHDVPEDTDYPFAELKQEFGDFVADGLHWLTNESIKYKKLPENERPPRKFRKEEDFRKLAQAPAIWQVVKLWDCTDNAYGMLLAPTDFVLNVWVPERRRLIEVIGSSDTDVAIQLHSALDWLQCFHRTNPVKR